MRASDEEPASAATSSAATGGPFRDDPACAAMLAILHDGRALTPVELAAATGFAAALVRARLAALEGAGMLIRRRQGPHHYFALAPGAAPALATRAPLAGTLPGSTWPEAVTGRVRTGPRDPAMRRARSCYNHLAGEFGVRMFDSMAARGLVLEGQDIAGGACPGGGDIILSDAGARFVSDFGIDLAALQTLRRPLCKSCLDWSLRRTHLGGSLGKAFLDRFRALGWARKADGTRTVTFTADGEKRLPELFPVG